MREDIEKLAIVFADRVLAIIAKQMGLDPAAGTGTKTAEVAGIVARSDKTKPRKKRGPLTCPVRNGQNRECGQPAAPRWGFVCTKHAAMPKSEKRKHREARKAARAQAQA